MIFVIFFFLVFAASAAEPDDEDARGQELAEMELAEAAREMRAAGRFQLNVKDLDMIQFIRFMSELLGENIVVSPGVGGTVSIVSPKPLSIRESRLVMISALEMNGLSLQNMGKYSKVTPRNAGPSTNNEVLKGLGGVTPGEQLVVQIAPLKHVMVSFVIEPVRMGVPDVNIIPVSGETTAVLTGSAVAVNRALGIIKALDVPDSARSVKTIQLNHTTSKLMEGHLNILARETTSKLAGLYAIGDERSGKIMLVGSVESLMEAEKLLKELDIQTTSNLHVYRLRNADATMISEQLSQILATASRLMPAANPQAMEGAGSALPASVVPDVATNSLILIATREQFEAIKTIIDELDIQPKQVLLRGLIAEVNLTKLNSAGVDWAAWGGTPSDNLLLGGSAQLGASGLPAQFMSWFTEMTREESITYDANGNAISTSNIRGMGLIYSYIKMLNQFNAINVLSMPRLMCTDNLPSALQVGQVIPQLKGQFSDIANPSMMQNSYEYKDTGLILKVTPHIRNGDLVALDIEQTVEDVLSTPGSATPVTSKRLIQTSVIVSDNETIILGGLIREIERTLKNRVPGLSYIPLVGNLFTSRERQREQVELMVFLTPRIIETPLQAAEATIEVTTGASGLSAGERETIEKYYEQFRASEAQEIVSLDITRQRRERRERDIEQLRREAGMD
ncbi:MAG: type II secretion system secretin GspD [Synergistaceae bacterium]|jgi:general secretion pathway protein D|nr:type II secretion system secretin GspD [Synergistaceae bacterium]